MDQPKLLSLSELARLLNISAPRAISLHQEGVLVCDFTGPNKQLLFRSSRIPELKKVVANQLTGLNRAIAARQRQVREQTRR